MANYRGDIHISQGLNAGIERILDAMQGRKDEEKQRARMFKSLVEYADTTGILTKDQAMTRSLEELDGIVKGTIAKQKFQEVTGLPKFYEALAEQSAGSGGEAGGRAQHQDILSLIAGASRQSGYAPPPENLDDIIRALSSQQQAPQLPMGGVLEVPGGGRLIGTGGQSAQFVAGKDPSGAESSMGKILMDLKAAEESGDEQGAAFLRLAAEKAATAEGMELEVGPDGVMRFRQGNLSKPSIASQTKMEQSLRKQEYVLDGLRRVKQTVRPQDVGVQGLVGETVVDSALAQVTRALGGTPKVDKDRITNREMVRLLSESMLKEISDETRFTDADAKRIRPMVLSLDAAKSYEQFSSTLDVLEREFSIRAQRDARGLGRKAFFAMTPEEIRAAVQAGEVTEEDAAAALVKFYPHLGFRNITPPPQRATTIPPGPPPMMQQPSRGQMLRY